MNMGYENRGKDSGFGFLESWIKAHWIRRYSSAYRTHLASDTRAERGGRDVKSSSHHGDLGRENIF